MLRRRCRFDCTAQRESVQGTGLRPAWPDNRSAVMLCHMAPGRYPVLLRAVLAALLAGAVPCAAQDAASPPPQGDWFRDHVRLSGETTASMSTKTAEEEGWFNYSDYEYSTVRRCACRWSAKSPWRSAWRSSPRSAPFSSTSPEAYALYVRVRPWLSHALDIHAGRIPPTFGAFPRRLYAADNPLIGMPLAFQYLTSNRADALPATADELARMRGRGWLTTTRSATPPRLLACPSPMPCAGTPASRCGGSTIRGRCTAPSRRGPSATPAVRRQRRAAAGRSGRIRASPGPEHRRAR